MKNAILAALFGLSSLTACGGPETTNPPSAGQHDDWVLLSADALATGDGSCQCITFASRELLPDGCTPSRNPDGTLIAVRYCEFPQRMQVPGRNPCTIGQPCYQPL